MNASRKLTLAAAAMLSGVLMYLRRRKNQRESLTGQHIKKSLHENPAYAKMRDRHRNKMD